jgi:hypothetical protein
MPCVDYQVIEDGDGDNYPFKLALIEIFFCLREKEGFGI